MKTPSLPEPAHGGYCLNCFHLLGHHQCLENSYDDVSLHGYRGSRCSGDDEGREGDEHHSHSHSNFPAADDLTRSAS
jgi:hypothetical protein